MRTATIRVGTRASTLARAQTQLVADGLRRASGHDIELVDVTTYGDTSRDPLARIGGAGVFVSALRDRLVDGTVDVAVHSLKDLPTAQPDGVRLAAVPVREDPRDALVTCRARSLDALPSGARVGTGSPRRAAQLRSVRPDVVVVDIRGNVDTRLRRVLGDARDDERLDAVVLAYAGLLRLGRGDLATEVLDPAVMLPAPGQGALAVECRAADAATAGLLAALDDAGTRAVASAERALLAELEAGCSAPVGALARVPARGTLELCGAVLAVNGAASIRRTATGPFGEPERLGRTLAAELLAEGAAAMLEEHVP